MIIRYLDSISRIPTNDIIEERWTILIRNLTVEKSIQLEADKKTVWNVLTNPKLTSNIFFNCEAISNWNTGDTITY